MRFPALPLPFRPWSPALDASPQGYPTSDADTCLHVQGAVRFGSGLEASRGQTPESLPVGARHHCVARLGGAIHPIVQFYTTLSMLIVHVCAVPRILLNPQHHESLHIARTSAQPVPAARTFYDFALEHVYNPVHWCWQCLQCSDCDLGYNVDHQR